MHWILCSSNISDKFSQVPRKRSLSVKKWHSFFLKVEIHTRVPYYFLSRILSLISSEEKYVSLFIKDDVTQRRICTIPFHINFLSFIYLPFRRNVQDKNMKLPRERRVASANRNGESVVELSERGVHFYFNKSSAGFWLFIFFLFSFFFLREKCREKEFRVTPKSLWPLILTSYERLFNSFSYLLLYFTVEFKIYVVVVVEKYKHQKINIALIKIVRD